MSWPDDADGDVFRRLLERGFDFSKEREIDFDVDFERWPLSEAVKSKIHQIYPTVEFFDPDEEQMEEGEATGYAQIRVRGKLSYEYVLRMQKEVTEALEQYGGWCESWGVWGE